MLLVAGRGGRERVLIDPMALDPSGTTTLDAWQPSIEGDLLAYQLSEGGTEESILRVLDVATGEVVDGPIDRARYSPVAWLPGGEAFYYVRRLDPAGLPEAEQQYHRRVWLHRVGTDPAEDVQVFGEGQDLRTYYGAWASRDGRWLVITAADGTAPRNDVWLADLAGGDPAAPRLKVVATGLDAHIGATSAATAGSTSPPTSTPRAAGSRSPTRPTRSPSTGATWSRPATTRSWRTTRSSTASSSATGRCWPSAWTRHAVSEVTVHDLADGTRLDGADGTVPLPGLGSVGGLLTRPDGGHEAWFSYTDHVTPPHVYRFDAAARRVEVFSAPPGAVDVPDVVTRQVAYHLGRRHHGPDVRDRPGRPGRPATVRPAPRPTVLYGYGGFGVPLSPGYSAGVLAWVEAGGVYAVANLRGGGEEGEDWHRAGMLGDEAERLRRLPRRGRVPARRAAGRAPGRLAISGGSNGGLLVGAALTQRPELFAAVVCSAPLLDMVRYEQFGLGATWNEEYGTAADAGAARLAARRTRPYHQVREGVELPGGAVHRVRRRHPGRPAARPQAVRRAAARHRRAAGRCCCAGRRTSGTAPGRCPAAWSWPPTRWRSLAGPAWRSRTVTLDAVTTSAPTSARRPGLCGGARHHSAPPLKVATLVLVER